MSAFTPQWSTLQKFFAFLGELHRAGLRAPFQQPSKHCRIHQNHNMVIAAQCLRRLRFGKWWEIMQCAGEQVEICIVYVSARQHRDINPFSLVLLFYKI